MKCKRCQAKAEVQIRHHNSAFCRSCYLFVFQRQVQRAIEHEQMFSPEEEILVAVSGGKDSLALWDVLVELGYRTAGLHLALGIGTYSQRSAAKTEAFARSRTVPLITVSLQEEGLAVPTLARFTNRPACAACGISKRHYFDRLAFERGFPVLATGHNLDDEAARLLGNVLRWRIHHLAKQRPVLHARHERLVRKVKPLFRISEYETAVYAFFRGIDYIVEECPNSAGATQLVYKDVLSRLEAVMPGTKLSFVQEFLRSCQAQFAGRVETPPQSCQRCGMPAFGSLCSFCGLVREVATKQQQPRQAPRNANSGR
ncbi:MAG: ATP-binding protein [Candidatus Binatia bacterium]